MHNQKIDLVLGYVAKGLGVRIVGAPGSGKTSLVRALVSRLEEDQVEVFSMFGSPALASVPFAGVLSLGLDLRSRTIGILGVADFLSAQLARTEAHVMVIDGVENLDRESLAVVNILRTRSNVPLVITVSDHPFQPKTPAADLAALPEASVTLAPLGYEQMHRLIVKVLGAPADVDVAAQILTKSGGNLRLAVRIIESSVLSECLLLKDGRWCMSGSGLMNEHLHGTVEGLLQGLRPDEVRALHKMSLLGPTPVRQLVTTVGEDVLDNLEVGGLVAVMSAPDGTPVATVFPPIVDDYLRVHAIESRRVLQSSVTGRVDVQPGRLPLPEAADNILSAAVSVLHAEMNGSHAATAGYFQERLTSLEQDCRLAWEGRRSLANAARLLAIYWGTPVDPERIQEVFSLTDTTVGTPGELFFFTVTHAWWTYTAKGDPHGAVASVRTLASQAPHLRPAAEALVAFLKSSSGRESKVTAPAPEVGSQGGAFAIIKGILELYRLNPGGALTALAAAEIPDELQSFGSFVRGMALFAGGRAEEALVQALELRQKALQDIDQFALVGQSYIAALSLLHHGLFDEAEYLMGRTFSLGTPGPMVGALHDAMLRLCSLRGFDAGSPSGNHGKAPDVGPLPGIATGLQDLASSRPVSAKSFDQRASRLVSKSLGRGFVLEAMHTALFALGLLPGPRVRNLLQRILEDSGIAAHDQFLAIADAAIQGELARLKHLLDVYVPDGDAYQISTLLRGAEQRWQLSGEPSTASDIARSAKDFRTRYRPMGAAINFRSEPPGSSLTLREIEVALVAGQQSNQEIAEHFGISIRTVESHISNALRKTDTTTRKQLADLIQGAPKAVLARAFGGFPYQDSIRLDAVMEG